MNNDKSQVFFEKPVEIMEIFKPATEEKNTFIVFLIKEKNMKNSDLCDILKFDIAIKDMIFIENTKSIVVQYILYTKIDDKKWNLSYMDIFRINDKNIEEKKINLDFNIFKNNIEFKDYIYLKKQLTKYIFDEIKKKTKSKYYKNYCFNDIYELNNDTIINIIKLNFNVFNELSKIEKEYHKKYQLDYNNLIPIFNRYIDEIFNKRIIRPKYMYKCEIKDKAPENKDKGECYYIEKEKSLSDFFDYIEKETTINNINENDFLQVLSDKEIIFNKKDKNFEVIRSFNKVDINVLLIFKDKIELSINHD